MASVLSWLVDTPGFRIIEVFVAWFPLLFAFLAINSSRQFLLDRRGIVTQRLEPDQGDIEVAYERWPRLTVIIPTHDGLGSVGRTIHDVQHLAWPELEIIVVDDGSSDGTRELLDGISRRHPELIVIHKPTNEGKSKALNDAIDIATGGLILISDDDALLPPATAVLLAAQLAHHDDLVAVTANPRMMKTERLIEKMQALEFSSTVSTQRRGHSAWGRISTISGVCTMFKADALRTIGGFDPTQPAEDIEITWRLQCRGWRVGYEPLAAIGTYPAPNLHGWFRQRRRWARGLVRALCANWRDIVRPGNFRVWPLLLEAVGSILWCHLLFFVTIVWAGCFVLGVRPENSFIVIGTWGTLVFCVAMIQILWGMHLDRHDDEGITRLRPFAPLFPLMYWWMLAFTVVVSTIPALVTRRRAVRW